MSSWFRVAALVALLVVAVTANGQTLGPNENPHPSVGIYAAEVGGGFLGELAAVAGVSLAVFGIGEATGADWLDESSIPYGILWVVALVPAIPAGSAGGACIVGHHYGGDGKFWAAGLGGLTGVGAGLVIAAMGQWKPSGIPVYAVAAVSPAIGATVGYNLSRSRNSYGDRFMPGSVGLASVRDAEGIAHPSLDVRLLTVKF